MIKYNGVKPFRVVLITCNNIIMMKNMCKGKLVYRTDCIGSQN